MVKVTVSDQKTDIETIVLPENIVKMIAEIPKNSHIYCLLKFSYPAPL